MVNTSPIVPDYGANPNSYHENGLTVGVYGGKFFPPHLGHMNFIRRASQMVDVLFVAVQYDEEHESKLCKGTMFTPPSPKQRVAWLTQELKDYPNVRVLAQYEHRSPHHLTDPLIKTTYEELTSLVGGHIDRIFSNTHEYDQYFNTWLPGVEHVVFEENRETHPISATQIREEGAFSHWDMLPVAVQRSYLKRVAFVGWESSGKSYHTQKLAQKWGTSFVPEYGRTYFDELGGYSSVETGADYINIAAGHLQALHYAHGRKIVFVDTDLVYTQFFYLETYGELNPVLDALIKADADRVNVRVFLEPHNRLEQDGTRKTLTYQERKMTSDRLKTLYAHYNKPLIVVDEVDDVKRFLEADRIIEQIINPPAQ